MDLMPFLFRILEALPGTEVVEQKTQLSLRYGGHPYAALYPATKTQAGLSFFLNERIDSPRIRGAAEVRPRRITHHMRLSDPGQIDGELIGWLRLAMAWERGR